MQIQPSRIENRTSDSNGVAHLGIGPDSKHSLEFLQIEGRVYMRCRSLIQGGFLLTTIQSGYCISFVLFADVFLRCSLRANLPTGVLLVSRLLHDRVI
jgi:hypothetical protein